MGNEKSVPLSSGVPLPFGRTEERPARTPVKQEEEPAYVLPLPKTGLLFSQFPNEVNYIIVNLLDADTLLRTSGTCKLWRANTLYLENLSLCLTNKSIQEQIDDGRFVKRPRFQLANINWKPLEATLKRFDPARIRTLHLFPDLLQSNEIVNNFISRAVNVTKLAVASTFQMDAILKLPKDRLKIINFAGAFDSRCNRFLNLENVSFAVVHNNYNEQPDLLGLRGLKKLTKITISGAAHTYCNLEHLGQLVQLKELSLNNAYLADEHFGYLSKLTNLEKLAMTYLRKEVPVDDSALDLSMDIMLEIGNPNPVSGLRHLTKLVNLTYLDISKVQNTYDGFGEPDPEGYDMADLVIKHFTKLKEINISSTALGTENRQKLKQISWLSVVDVIDQWFKVDGQQDA